MAGLSGRCSNRIYGGSKVPTKGWVPSEETRARYRAAWDRRRARLPDFWDRVEKTATCWFWTGTSNDDYYGQYQRNGRAHLAHRYAYEEAVGPIPDGLELDHLCRVPRCVRPSHLEPVTPRVNQRRGMGFSGLNARKTHCANGHPFALFGKYQKTGKRVGRRRCGACEHRDRRPIEYLGRVEGPRL